LGAFATQSPGELEWGAQAGNVCRDFALDRDAGAVPSRGPPNAPGAFLSVANHTNRGQATKNDDSKLGHRAVFVARGTNLTVIMAEEVLTSTTILILVFRRLPVVHRLQQSFQKHGVAHGLDRGRSGFIDHAFCLQ
jgi:hypothetical protein